MLKRHNTEKIEITNSLRVETLSMQSYLRKILLVLFLGLFVIMTTAAQDDCPAIVQNALTSADQWCQATSRNQVCYGNDALTTQLQPGYETIPVAQVGDIMDVMGVRGMQLTAMDTEAGTRNRATKSAN